MRSARGTIFLEQARVIWQLAYDAEQFVLRLAAPKCAAHAEPGSFVHLTCDASIPMRRPLSIMRAHPREGWIELLYKVVGAGLHSLAARKAGEELSVLGPIGRPFVPHPERPPVLDDAGPERQALLHRCDVETCERSTASVLKANRTGSRPPSRKGADS